VGGGRRAENGTRPAAFLGAATGVTFGLTAALMKTMTGAVAHGFLTILTTWPTYAMIATGALGMFLLQSALSAGPLVAAQPGFSGADPVVSVMWGVVVFGERFRGGRDLVGSVAFAALAVAGVVRLCRSPLLAGNATKPAETHEGTHQA
jgi:multidrug transporter EmrE-like cation transporter